MHPSITAAGVTVTYTGSGTGAAPGAVLWHGASPPAAPLALPPPDPWLQTKAAPAKRSGPPISTGMFVALGDTKGRVDLVVVNGTVPGATATGGDEVTGTAEAPAARIVEFAPSGTGVYQATGRRLAAPVTDLVRIPPLRTREAKSLPEALAWAQWAYFDSPTPGPSAYTLGRVYARGHDTWPGDHATTLTRDQWALGRVDAFTATWHGDRPPHYRSDDDLLPGGGR